MQFTDKVSKKFLTYSNKTDKTDYMTDYQDPTYMGFQIKLVTPRPGDLSDTDFDDLPHGLFRANPKTDPYSCYTYLMRRGETLRANYILEFEEGFKKIVNECPWYFVSVSGLGDIWKFDPANNWRAKDKKITIETLESIDLKMTYLVDLYRKAVYDVAWMRHAVPDHMKWFKMEIIVSEVRPMKIGAASLNNTSFSGYPISIEKSNLRNPGPDEKDAPIKDDGIGLVDPTAPWSTGTFIKFSFSECEIDIFEESPTYLDTVTASTNNTPATNKLTIKPGVVYESNRYGLLGAILEDTLNWWDYTDTELDFGFPNNKSTSNDPIQNQLNISSPDEGMSDRNKAINNLKSSYKNTTQVSSEVGNLEELKREKGLLERLGKTAIGAGIKGAVENLIQTRVNKLLLGNVYGISPLSLIGSAQSIINNPVAAVEAILAKHSSPIIGKEIAKKVNLTSVEIDLIKDIIGVANMQSVTSPTISAQKVQLDSAPLSPSSDKKVDLEEAVVIPSVDKKVSFSGASPSPSSDKKVVLTQPPIDKADDPKVYLRAPRKSRGNVEKTNLTTFVNAGTIPGSVSFEEPQKPRARRQKVKLEEPNIIKSNQEKVELTAPEITKVNLGNVNLEEPKIDKESYLGKVDLS